MRPGVVWCWVVVAVAAGCGGDGRARFVPAEAAAREALEAALRAWQDGQAPGPVAGTAPLVQVVDGHRRPGQRLQAFAVLGPAPGDGPRVFAVRLTLDGPREEQKVRYVVLGIDPLWVVRYEDYEMMAHWDHPMDDDGTRKTLKK
jgi:hypothetical protein